MTESKGPTLPVEIPEVSVAAPHPHGFMLRETEDELVVGMPNPASEATKVLAVLLMLFMGSIGVAGLIGAGWILFNGMAVGALMTVLVGGFVVWAGLFLARRVFQSSEELSWLTVRGRDITLVTSTLEELSRTTYYPDCSAPTLKRVANMSTEQGDWNRGLALVVMTSHGTQELLRGNASERDQFEALVELLAARLPGDPSPTDAD